MSNGWREPASTVSRRIATILARAGSKGLPHKNIAGFAGESLLARSVRQAKRCGLFDVVTVSSDSAAYLAIAENAGADVVVKRPDEMANATVTKLPAIRHAVEHCESRLNVRFDTVADLATTSPLRSDQDISGAIELLESSGAPLVLSGHEAPDNPYFNLLERDGECGWALCKERQGRFGARQQAPKVIALNGAVYVWNREAIGAEDDRVVRPGLEVYLMPKERAVDIDDVFDLRLAELMLQMRESAA